MMIGDSDEPGDQPRIEADQAHQPCPEGVADHAGVERDRHDPEQVREHGEDRADNEPDHPARDGGQEPDPEQGLDRLCPKHEAEEESPDRKQDQEELVPVEQDDQSKSQSDQSSAQQFERRRHLCLLLSEYGRRRFEVSGWRPFCHVVTLPVGWSCALWKGTAGVYNPPIPADAPTLPGPTKSVDKPKAL